MSLLAFTFLASTVVTIKRGIPTATALVIILVVVIPFFPKAPFPSEAPALSDAIFFKHSLSSPQISTALLSFMVCAVTWHLPTLSLHACPAGHVSARATAGRKSDPCTGLITSSKQSKSERNFITVFIRSPKEFKSIKLL